MSENLKLKIIFFGTPIFVLSVLEALNKNFNLVGVVTSPDQKLGRKQQLTASPVKQFAINHKIPVFDFETLDQQAIQKLSDLKPDLIVVAAYGKIIPQNILDIPKFGALNIHPSLLPKYRGASPIQAAILNGDKLSGISIIKMDEKMDHGPLVITKEISLSNTDNFQTLSTKMFEEATEILIKIIPDFFSGKIIPRVQDHAGAVYCSLIKKGDGYFEINNPPNPQILDRMIRAYYPWPTAWSKWNGKIVKFYPNNEIQMEGKKPVPLADFLRGYPSFPIKST